MAESVRERINEFRLTHDAVFELLFDAVNPNYQTDGLFENCITAVYDDYCITYNLNSKKYFRVLYSKNEAANEVSIGEKIEVFIVDVTSEEYAALQYIQSLGESYSEIAESFKVIEEFKTKNPTFDFSSEPEFIEKVEEPEQEEVEEIEEEKDVEFELKINNLEKEVDSLKEENQALKEFKEKVELETKKSLIESYSDKISESELEKFTVELISGLTYEQLDKELAYCLVKTTNFTAIKKAGKVPNNSEENKNSIVKLLENYIIKD